MIRTVLRSVQDLRLAKVREMPPIGAAELIATYRERLDAAMPRRNGAPIEEWPEEHSFGPLQLVVLQASPFCNLDCSYCYLPNRSKKATMASETLELALQRIFESPWVGPELGLCWHAGEPLAVPIDFYHRAMNILAKVRRSSTHVYSSVVTNGTAIDEDWCKFIKEHDWRVTVSIDGPAVLHDRHRVTRAGRGTHARTMRGISLLKEHGIPFSTISVVTRETLEFPDEMFSFFDRLGTTAVCFNFEEQENQREKSSLDGADSLPELHGFLTRFFKLYARYRPEFSIRELEVTLGSLHAASRAPVQRPGAEAWPFHILSIDWQGGFATFSPELLGERTPGFGDWTIGNVRDHSLVEASRSPEFRKQLDAIVSGLRACQSSCPYFITCGGGSPSNKIGENGTPDSAETQFCRIRSQLLPEMQLAGDLPTPARFRGIEPR